MYLENISQTINLSVGPTSLWITKRKTILKYSYQIGPQHLVFKIYHILTSQKLLYLLYNTILPYIFIFATLLITNQPSHNHTTNAYCSPKTQIPTKNSKHLPKTQQIHYKNPNNPITNTTPPLPTKISLEPKNPKKKKKEPTKYSEKTQQTHSKNN